MANSRVINISNRLFQKFAIQGHRENIGPSLEEQLTYYAIGLGSEAGEVLGDIMKHCYYVSPKANRDSIILELGDVIWYLANICELLGTTLDDVQRINIEKLCNRYPDDRHYPSDCA